MFFVYNSKGFFVTTTCNEEEADFLAYCEGGYYTQKKR